MYILRNSNEVILKIVSDIAPYKSNKFGCLVPCLRDEAEYFLSDGKIVEIGTEYHQIFDAIQVEDIPKYVKPMMYKYGTAWSDDETEEKFYLNEDEYVDSIENLTQRVAMLEEMVMELSKGVYEHE